MITTLCSHTILIIDKALGKLFKENSRLENVIKEQKQNENIRIKEMLSNNSVELQAECKIK